MLLLALTTYFTYNLLPFLFMVDSIPLWECRYLSVTSHQSGPNLLHPSCWLSQGTDMFMGIWKPRAMGCKLLIILSVVNPRPFLNSQPWKCEMNFDRFFHWYWFRFDDDTSFWCYCTKNLQNILEMSVMFYSCK